MLKEVFRWLDGHPLAYWLGAGGSLLLLGAWLLAAWRHRDETRARPRAEWVLGLLLLAVIFAWRWPPLFVPWNFNPDESLMVTGALTLEQDPVFWRSVDGGTCGPLNFYALLPTHWLGVPQDYFNARLTGLLLTWGALWLCYRLLRRDYGSFLAALGILPGLLFFATTTDNDFLQYSTETLSLFLFTLGAALLWRAHRERPAGGAPPPWTWLAAGFVMGLLPWAKLQAAPLAAALAAWGTVLALSQASRPWPARLATVARLATAALAPSVFILLLVLLTGQWEHFFSSYIVSNIAYVNNGWEYTPAIRMMINQAKSTWSFPSFLVVPLLVVLLAGLRRALRAHRPGPLFIMGAAVTVAACGCVVAPRHGFSHYLLFLVMPLTWWGGAALGELWQELASPRQRLGLGAGFALLAVAIPLFAFTRLAGPPFFGQLEENWRHPYGEAGRLLRHLRRPGDRLVVWGWNCQLHVESGLPQATREAASEHQIRDSAQRDGYFRPRYLADLVRNRPVFFVDAVGPGAFTFFDRPSAAHEVFPELRDYVQAHYVLLRDLDYARIYVRADRSPALAKP